jgi:hypothetical protein
MWVNECLNFGGERMAIAHNGGTVTWIIYIKRWKRKRKKGKDHFRIEWMP